MDDWDGRLAPTDGITIGEVKAEKKRMEQKILVVVQEFQQRTGCRIDRISYSRTTKSDINGNKVVLNDSVSVDIQIPLAR